MDPSSGVLTVYLAPWAGAARPAFKDGGGVEQRPAPFCLSARAVIISLAAQVGPRVSAHRGRSTNRLARQFMTDAAFSRSGVVLFRNVYYPTQLLHHGLFRFIVSLYFFRTPRTRHGSSRHSTDIKHALETSSSARI